MEQNGYTEESYEEWKENDMRTELFSESMEELTEKRLLLGVFRDAMDSLMPEERELAMKVFGEEMPMAEYDMYAESRNDSCNYVVLGTQEDMDRFILMKQL